MSICCWYCLVLCRMWYWEHEVGLLAANASREHQVSRGWILLRATEKSIIILLFLCVTVWLSKKIGNLSALRHFLHLAILPTFLTGDDRHKAVKKYATISHLANTKFADVSSFHSPTQRPIFVFGRVVFTFPLSHGSFCMHIACATVHIKACKSTFIFQPNEPDCSLRPRHPSFGSQLSWIKKCNSDAPAPAHAYIDEPKGYYLQISGTNSQVQ